MSATHVKKTLVTLLMAAGSLFVHPTADAGDDQRQPAPIRDLRYGAALFDFYQAQYFDAITGLLVAQQRSPITRQGDEPQLLLGSLYLSYGMDQRAAEIFQQLLHREVAPDTHDLAWFYLGKLRYDSGRFHDALTAFEAVGDALPKARNNERLQLMVNAFLHEQDFTRAAKTLAQLDDGGIWKHYAQYNLGIALIRAKRGAEGMALLKTTGQLAPRDEEEYALRDKANTALGYALLQGRALPDSAAAFAEVRLHGPFSSQALLGMGWARTAQDMPQEALASWFELDARPADLASQEARLAVAYTLEKLGSPELALNYYQRAIAAYDREHSDIATVLAITDFDDLLQAGLPVTSDAGTPAAAFPAREYLVDVLASAEFQKAYRDYRDLHNLQALIAQWQQKIPLLLAMLEQRRLQYTRNIAQLATADYAQRLAALGERRDLLAAKIASIAGEETSEALADDHEQATLIRLRDIASRLDELSRRGADVTAQAGKLRILSGLMHWRLKSEFPERLWNVRRELRALDLAFEQSAQSRATLDALLKLTPLNFDQIAAQIAAQEEHLATLSRQTDAAVARQKRYCAGLIRDQLVASQLRIASYRDRARYAEARLYDQLSHDPRTP